MSPPTLPIPLPFNAGCTISHARRERWRTCRGDRAQRPRELRSLQLFSVRAGEPDLELPVERVLLGDRETALPATIPPGGTFEVTVFFRDARAVLSQRGFGFRGRAEFDDATLEATTAVSRVIRDPIRRR